MATSFRTEQLPIDILGALWIEASPPRGGNHYLVTAKTNVVVRGTRISIIPMHIVEDAIHPRLSIGQKFVVDASLASNFDGNHLLSVVNRAVLHYKHDEPTFYSQFDVTRVKSQGQVLHCSSSPLTAATDSRCFLLVLHRQWHVNNRRATQFIVGYIVPEDMLPAATELIRTVGAIVDFQGILSGYCHVRKCFIVTRHDFHVIYLLKPHITDYLSIDALNVGNVISLRGVVVAHQQATNTWEIEVSEVQMIQVQPAVRESRRQRGLAPLPLLPKYTKHRVQVHAVAVQSINESRP
ncbi:uncharacterized protein MELLADRAFT_110867 [Melampsora larici-populina 98AG31]|uniref:Uncharacterized protein n=1 Tax=Melampsora larici-populina (strain 98AG31 / pathotype 3-4-7) TaxID=747676 RepID=F4S191_MELLP|nr:uncharacterized protein MELLADRAFT_110867 [Melampsora larici-populina 98AG31]EGG01524.1 hypothetical protein MELLADRAFT_110867 [Melampsora larici-populina 98AG31]